MLLPCIWWWSWGTCADVPDLPAAGNMHARCCCSDAVHVASGACMAWPWPCPALEGSDPEPSVNMLGSGVVRGLVRSPPARPVTATCGTAHGRRRPGRSLPSIPRSAPVPPRGLADAPSCACGAQTDQSQLGNYTCAPRAYLGWTWT